MSFLLSLAIDHRPDAVRLSQKGTSPDDDYVAFGETFANLYLTLGEKADNNPACFDPIIANYLYHRPLRPKQQRRQRNRHTATLSQVYCCSRERTNPQQRIVLERNSDLAKLRDRIDCR